MRFNPWGLVVPAIAVAAMSSASASETFTFRSGVLNGDNPSDTSSFTLTLTTPTVLEDGIYEWGSNNLGQTNTHIPPGVTFSFTDGYTTLTDPADLTPRFQFRITGGRMNQVDGSLGLYAQDPSHHDPYFGYTTFYIGGAGTQLIDALDPNIVGLTGYSGNVPVHIPVAAGGAGTWTYAVSDVPAVPEPASYAMTAAGLALLVLVQRKHRSPSERTPNRSMSPFVG